MFLRDATLRQTGLRGLFLLLALLVLSLSVACEKTPKEKLLKARAAVASGQPDAAEKALKEVLAADPSLFEAQRLQADVHQLREEFDKAEEKLDSLWNKKGFGDEAKKFSVEEKQQKRLMEGQYLTLYKEWADSINAKDNPAKFEEVVKKGLEREKKNRRLNALLVEFYLGKGERLVKDGKKLEAAKVYEEVLTLRARPEERDKARNESLKLRREVFTEKANKHFEEQVKPKLVKEERFDAEKNLVIVKVEKEIDRALRPGRDEDEKKALAMAGATLALEAAKTVLTIAGLPLDTPFPNKPVPGMAVGEKEFKRGSYTITATLDPNKAIRFAFDLAEKQRKAKEEKAEAGDAKMDEGKKDDGKEGDGKEGDAKEKVEDKDGKAKEGAEKAAEKN